MNQPSEAEIERLADQSCQLSSAVRLLADAADNCEVVITALTDVVIDAARMADMDPPRLCAMFVEMVARRARPTDNEHEGELASIALGGNAVGLLCIKAGIEGVHVGTKPRKPEQAKP